MYVTHLAATVLLALLGHPALATGAPAPPVTPAEAALPPAAPAMRVSAPAAPVPAATRAPKPGPMDLCPICGMVVAKYPHWIATIVWKDGRPQHFDGAKDLFKFLTALDKHAAGRPAADLETIAVTDFYDLVPVDARTAFYVIGSDVLGPMGHELVPLATKEAAEEFLQDHRGRRVVRFADVTPQLTLDLDAGKF